jgi:hypothetical protein
VLGASKTGIVAFSSATSFDEADLVGEKAFGDLSARAPEVNLLGDMVVVVKMSIVESAGAVAD